MARYLVTGGAGFIGSHVVDRLLAAGSSVVVLDNFHDLYDPQLKRRNVAPHLEHEAYRLVTGDLRRPEDLREAFKGGVDKVIHLAALAGVRRSLQEPATYVDINVRGTVNVLEAARDAGVGDVAFASSSSVYGRNTKVPFHEDDRVDQPMSPYGATKRSGELISQTYCHLYGMNVSCLRLFTVYGPRQRPEMAIHRFARLIEDGEPIPMFGDGSTLRDYTFVDDVVDGILQAAERVDGYRVYNLGGSRTTALRDLISHLESAIGKQALVERLPEQAGDVQVTHADLTRSREELGFAPDIPLEEGLRRFVTWMRRRQR